MIIHQVTSLHSLSTASTQEPGSWNRGKNGGSTHSRLLAISMEQHTTHSRLLAISMKQHTRVWCTL